MAAGCTHRRGRLRHLRAALRSASRTNGSTPAALARTLHTDGPLEPQWFNAETVRTLDAQVWGQAFEAPLFCDEVDIVSQRIVGDRHLKLSVRQGRAACARRSGSAAPSRCPSACGSPTG